jgi:hypothetical protein
LGSVAHAVDCTYLMTASIPIHAGLDHRTADSDPTAPWSPVPQAYSELAPEDDYPAESAAPRFYGNGPVIAALVGAGLACAALGLVIVDNITVSAPRTVTVAPGAATGPATPGIGADFVAPAGIPAPPAPAAAPMPDPAPVVVPGPAPVGVDSPPPPPPPPPAPVPADAPPPPDPAAADPGAPPPPPSGPVVVVPVPMPVPVVPIPPPVHILPPPPPPIVKPAPAPVIPLPIVKLPPPPAPAPAVCLPPHHMVSGHCV